MTLIDREQKIENKSQIKNKRQRTHCLTLFFELLGIVFCLGFVVWCLLFSARAFAMTGQELAQKVYDRDDGDDAFFRTEMVLIDKNGRERRRLLETCVRDDGNRIRSYLEFLEPKDIEGTRFLSWENEGADDTQYLYLPELGRARRIVSSQKRLQFVNTDFTYEDMQRRRPEEDGHLITGETLYLDRPAYILESTARPGTSQYARRVSLVDAEALVPVSVDYFDAKDRMIKTFRVLDLKKAGGIWTGMLVEMHDLKADHRTRMRILEVRYNTGIPQQVFELRNLEHE